MVGCWLLAVGWLVGCFADGVVVTGDQLLNDGSGCWYGWRCWLGAFLLLLNLLMTVLLLN
jgi:hypothetical protein